MNSITIPDEAVEAAGTAIYETLEDMRFHPVTDTARAALAAAMPHLHPTIPNTVDALEQLANTSDAQVVIRGLDRDDDPFTVVCVSWDSVNLGLWVTDAGEVWHTESLVDLTTSSDIRITEWTVLWPLGGVA